MKRLILVRHAKSDWSDSDLHDFDRPLNKRGEKNAPFMGKRLRKRGVKPERIISSPAKRARDTARLLARQLTILESGVIFKDSIYEAGTAELLEVIHNIPEALECVMLIGHNPGLLELANQLGEASFENLPTCAAVGFDLDVSKWEKTKPRCGRLWFYDYPKNPDPVPGDKSADEDQGKTK